MKRYIIDGRSIVERTTGISRYSIELLKGYVRRFGADNVTVILMNGISLGICKEIHTSYDRYKLFDIIKFSYMLYNMEYDVYHSGDLIGPIFRKRNVQHILTVHDLMYLVVPSFLGASTIRTKLQIWKSKIIDVLKLRVADRIISISQTTANDLRRIMGLNSIVLREGCNKLPCSNNYRCNRKELLNLRQNDFFLYVGLGYPHKNIQFMINAFMNARTTKKLVICGKKHPLSANQYENVIFTGWISDEDLDYLYKRCAAFVFPSLYEGFGLPILEALSYKKKVLSSNAGSLSEFSTEFVSFFDPHNEKELSMLMENVDNIKLDCKALTKYLEYFDWKNIWDEYHNMFNVEKDENNKVIYT